jgi:hypothetical protein
VFSLFFSILGYLIIAEGSDKLLCLDRNCAVGSVEATNWLNLYEISIATLIPYGFRVRLCIYDNALKSF